MPTECKSEAEILADNTALQSQVAGLQTQILNLTGERDKLTGERDKAKADLATANTTVATLTGERDTARAELKAEKDKVATLTTERDGYKAKSDPIQKQLSQKLVELGIHKGAPNSEGKGGTVANMNVSEICAAVRAGIITPEDGNRLISERRKAKAAA